MLSKLSKNRIFLSIAIFSFLTFHSIALAVNYGSGTYGSNPYSSYTPSSPTPTSNDTKNNIPINIVQEISDINKQAINTIVVDTPSTIRATLSITKTLKQGMKINDVLNLQAYLNSIGYTVAIKGAGSVGKETNYFGPATKRAVISFQKAKGLKQDGIVGPNTRKALKEF